MNYLARLGTKVAQVQIDKGSLPDGSLTDATLRTVLQIVFGIAGGIALLIITIAALQYVISRGEPQAVAKAKNTILYALIGLVVCLFAFTIVTFVIRGVE